MVRKIGMRRLLALLLSFIAISAYADIPEQDMQALKSAMEDRLKDAESARYKDVRIGKDGITTCGRVNSKNSYGAYTGYVPFLAIKLSTGKFLVIGIDEASETLCKEKGV
jgi:hypothetical protein